MFVSGFICRTAAESMAAVEVSVVNVSLILTPVFSSTFSPSVLRELFRRSPLLSVIMSWMGYSEHNFWNSVRRTRLQNEFRLQGIVGQIFTLCLCWPELHWKNRRFRFIRQHSENRFVGAWTLKNCSTGLSWYRESIRRQNCDLWIHCRTSQTVVFNCSWGWWSTTFIQRDEKQNYWRRLSHTDERYAMRD